GEGRDVGSKRHAVGRVRLARDAVAAEESKSQDGRHDKPVACHHRLGAPGRGGAATGGPVCAVGTGCALDTTKPVARPKATWEAMNQAQSTRALSAGLITPRSPHRKPVHRRGATRPPQSMCRPGSMGRITAQSKPANPEIR